MTDLNGKNFVALVRLSNGADETIADVGQTCERVPEPKAGGGQGRALELLLASGLIAPAPVGEPAPMAAPVESEDA